MPVEAAAAAVGIVLLALGLSFIGLSLRWGQRQRPKRRVDDLIKPGSEPRRKRH